HARNRARTRAQQRAAESRSDSGEQRRAAAAGAGKGRIVGENRFDELLQGLRGQPEMRWSAAASRGARRWLVRLIAFVVAEGPVYAGSVGVVECVLGRVRLHSRAGGEHRDQVRYQF